MTDKPKISIAYLSVNDPLDKRSWSGTTYYIGQTLARNAGKVDFLGPVKIPWLLQKILNAFAKITRLLTGRRYETKYSLLLSWYTSRILKRRMQEKKYDCIVAPAASSELSFFKTHFPVIYISDTTFHLISKYYMEDFRDLSRLSEWEGNKVEKRALEKAGAVIFSSQWAAHSATSDYNISALKIHVLPLGANMDEFPPREIIHLKNSTPVLTLLFLAVYWERKGGAIAFGAFKKIRATGVNAKFIVCGCIPPPEYADPDMEVIPFLNKNKQEDHDRFIQLLSTCHFLVLPTRADCSLLVACEANAYGMPAITTRTGGVPDIVVDGENGYCLPPEAGGEQYGDLINEIFQDKERYNQLVLSSRNRFEKRLNWDKWAEDFIRIFEAMEKPV